MDSLTLTGISLFGLGTIILALISRAALVEPGSHGFYRFFAWEFLLALFLRNAPDWFEQPLAWNQLISWALLLVSLFLVIHSARLLQRSGAQHAGRPGDGLYAFEKTTRLVMTGAYRYIRHPLYSSLLFLGWGMFFKSPDPLDGLLALAATVLLLATAKAEERENLAYFGEQYRAYMHRTKRFIPFVF